MQAQTSIAILVYVFVVITGVVVVVSGDAEPKAALITHHGSSLPHTTPSPPIHPLHPHLYTPHHHTTPLPHTTPSSHPHLYTVQHHTTPYTPLHYPQPHHYYHTTPLTYNQNNNNHYRHFSYPSTAPKFRSLFDYTSEYDVTAAYGYESVAATCPYNYDDAPTCSYNTTKPWCLYDPEYPEKELKDALEYHKAEALPLYADVTDLNTASSVYRPRRLEDETYLCPTEIGYVRPLRARNTDGKWRIIVNNVKADYEDFTQTTRVEECVSLTSCPLVPHCYESKCLQKSIYHRFLVYDPCDQYFPFSVETFKLPASCACLLGAKTLDH